MTIGDIVVVTGFGPFRDYKVNPSWEAVKELKNVGIKDLNAELVTIELPVVYDTVVEHVPKLWKKYKPSLVVHVGVSRAASELTLETLAHKNGYKSADVENKQPPSGICPLGEKPSIEPGLDLSKISAQLNATCTDLSSIISCDAGRYLCEFTFYCSLSIDKDRTVFVHVPDDQNEYSATKMANGLKEIIGLLLDQIRAKQKIPEREESQIVGSAK